jgi:hypothetical protein
LKKDEETKGRAHLLNSKKLSPIKEWVKFDAWFVLEGRNWSIKHCLLKLMD